MYRNIKDSILTYLLMILIIIIYTVSLYTIGNYFWPQYTNSQLIFNSGGEVKGSLLLAQDRNNDRYFKPRPNSNTLNSCSLALYNPDLIKHLNLQIKNHATISDISEIAPSASGLDPYITTFSALDQAKKLSIHRNINYSIIKKLIDKYALKPIYPFFELEIVNTTILNLELDKL